MLIFDKICKAYGTQQVLDNVSFKINDGERIGLVGPNGAGKSTIFALVSGKIDPDSGAMIIEGKPRIGHLRQEFMAYESSSNLLEHAEGGKHELAEIHARIEALEKSLADSGNKSSKAELDELGHLQSRFEAEGGYSLRARASAALSGLGFNDEKFFLPFNSFSGGWQMRAELARTLLAEPDLLLLDEPTNYLDIPAIEWLRGFLASFKGTLILISHDRYLLNTLTCATIEVANMKCERYNAPYDAYVKERQLRYEQRLAAAESQRREREKAQIFIDRFRAKNTKASLVQSKIKQLEKMEEIQIPKPIHSPGKIRLKNPERCGQEVARIESVSHSYDGKDWVLRNVSASIQRGDKTALVGLNGTGKSTFLRIVAGKISPTEGSVLLGHNVNRGYQSQEFAEAMDPNATVFETIRNYDESITSQEIRNLLGGFGFSGDSVEKKVSVLSGGEKIRLAFAKLLSNPPNFLILDEPTTHLDIAARQSLENALKDFSGTILVVSHDLEFVKHVATGIIAMRPPGIAKYHGGYDYYCEKRAQEAEPQEEAPRERKESERKTQRRERALEVQERGRAKTRLRTALAEIEKKIYELENEEGKLVSELQNPEKNTDYATVNRRLSEIHSELPKLMNEWQKLMEELEVFVY